MEKKHDESKSMANIKAIKKLAAQFESKSDGGHLLCVAGERNEAIQNFEICFCAVGDDEIIVRMLVSTMKREPALYDTLVAAIKKYEGGSNA